MSHSNDLKPLHIAADVMLIICHEYEVTPRLGDAILLAQGRIHRWKKWPLLSTAIQDYLLQALRHTNIGSCGKRNLLREFVGRCEADDSPVVLVAGHKATTDDEQKQYEVKATKPVEQLLSEYIGQLEQKNRLEPIVFHRQKQDITLYKSFKGEHFLVPSAKIPDEMKPISLQTMPVMPNVKVSIHEIKCHASKLAVITGEVFYEQITFNFLNELRQASSEPISDDMQLSAGELQLLIAPTGRGKSVFTRVLATLLLSKGVTLTLVVPVIRDVINEYRVISSLVKKLALTPSISMLFSNRQLGTQICQQLEANIADEKPEDVDWIINNLTYHCQMSAYAELDVQRTFGDEPCNNSRFLCPFMSTCAKFKFQRKAVNAGLIIVNHHAYLSGRMRLPVVDENGLEVRTILGLLSHSSQVVLIDEIDLLQQILINLNVGEIELSKARGATNAGAVIRDLADNGTSRNNYDVMDPLYDLERLTLLIREAINDGIVVWPKRYGYMDIGAVMPVALEADIFELFKEIFPSIDEADITAFFEHKPNISNTWADLNKALQYWLQSNTYTGMTDSDRKTKVFDTLSLLYEEIECKPYVPDDGAMKKMNSLASRLILFCFLSHLQEILKKVTYSFNSTDLRNSQDAAEFYGQLIGYHPWSASPHGPLGGRFFGFHLSGKDKHKQLKVMSLSGDPHSAIFELGNLTSRAMCGHHRVVLGLSATARFPGASASDVFGKVAYYQPDNSQDIKLALEQVIYKDKGIVVSGQMKNREKNIRLLASGLWEQSLKAHLETLKKTNKGRARVLLVTGSHKEAEYVADSLSQAIGIEQSFKRIRYLVPNDPDGEVAHSGLAIRRDDLPKFASTGADILVACFSSISRGHNILQPGLPESAIGSIFVLVRPVPQFNAPQLALAHVSYCIRNMEAIAPKPLEALKWEQSRAHFQLRYYYNGIGPVKHLHDDLKMEYFCNAIVEMLQLAGRGRRGGTNISVYLVDSAFDDDAASWKQFAKATIAQWRQLGFFEEMKLLHGALVHALEEFTGHNKKR